MHLIPSLAGEDVFSFGYFRALGIRDASQQEFRFNSLDSAVPAKIFSELSGFIPLFKDLNLGHLSQILRASLSHCFYLQISFFVSLNKSDNNLLSCQEGGDGPS